MKSISRMLIFAEVVKQGSFTLAADALQMNKSNVSQHITQLEKELGTRLINRTTRCLSLTDIGQQFAQRCFQLQALVNQTLDEVQEFEQLPQGTLSLTAPHALETGLILPVLSELSQIFPQLQLRLLITDRRLDLVKHNLDLAISVGSLRDSNYRISYLGSLRDIFCASPDLIPHIASIQNPVELHPYPFIATNWQQGHKEHQIFHPSRGQLCLSLQPKIQVNNSPTAAHLASLAMGFALLPNIFVYPFFEKGQLTPVLPHWYAYESPIYAVHPYGDRIPLKVKRFLELLKNYLSITLKKEALWHSKPIVT